jgi:putative methyltransferase (TIGR04325 family)
MSDPAPSPVSLLKRVAVRLLPPIVTDAIRALLARRRETRAEPATLAAAESAVPSFAVADGPREIAPIPAPDSPAEPALAATPEPPEWEIVPDTDEVWASLAGWDHDSIVATQLAKWPDFLKTVAGPGLMGRSHEATHGGVDLATHNTLLSFGYALGRVCSDGAEVSVLDWGGGLGHYALYAKALFPEQRFDFHVKDLPGLCVAGSALLPDVTFHDDDSSAFARSYDFVLASSAVHYARDPYRKMRELCAVARRRILITRTPILEDGDDALVVQRPHRYGYLTEYAGWMMNRRRLIDSVEANGFVLERQLLIGERTHLPDITEQAQYYGFLFRRI